MAAIQLLTAVVLNFVQFWQTSGQSKNRAFLASCSIGFIGCSTTKLAKLIALSTILYCGKNSLVFVWLVLHHGYEIVHS